MCGVPRLLLYTRLLTRLRHIPAMSNFAKQIGPRQVHSKAGKDARILKSANEVILFALASKDEMMDTGDVRVHMSRVAQSTTGDLDDRVEITETLRDSFGLISVRNVPPPAGRQANSSVSPTSKELEVYSVRMAGDFADQVRTASR